MKKEAAFFILVNCLFWTAMKAQENGSLEKWSDHILFTSVGQGQAVFHPSYPGNSSFNLGNSIRFILTANRDPVHASGQHVGF